MIQASRIGVDAYQRYGKPAEAMEKCGIHIKLLVIVVNVQSTAAHW